jgi:hypothetical protein
MFKIFWLILLLLTLSPSTVAQKGNALNSPSNIPAYSYFIYGIKNNNSIEQGTGFFLTKGRQLYFVTSAHLILSWDFKNNISTYPKIDSFFIRLPRKNSTDFYFFPISVKTIRESSVKGYAFQYPDICMIKMPNLEDYQINFISIDRKNYPIKDIISEVYISGYPVNDTINDRKTYMELPPTVSEGKIIADYFKKVFWLENGISDSINYQVKIIKGPCKSGISGSPIFIRTLNSNELIFGGIAVMGDPLTMDIHSVRPEFVLNELKKK